eukprot:7062880-Prymnesium_polylepis.1
MARLPPSVPFNGREITLWTADQLEVSSKLNLKQRALNLRDLVGADQLPPLNPAGPPAGIVHPAREPRMRGACGAPTRPDATNERPLSAKPCLAASDPVAD